MKLQGILAAGRLIPRWGARARGRGTTATGHGAALILSVYYTYRAKGKPTDMHGVHCDSDMHIQCHASVMIGVGAAREQTRGAPHRSASL